jgi:hypothetical protein
MRWMTPVIGDFPQNYDIDAASLQRSFIVLEMFRPLIRPAIYGVSPLEYVVGLLLVGAQEC